MSEQTQAPPQKVRTIPARRWPKDPVEFLLQKGWEPDGDPGHPATLWLDPTKPRADTEERRKVGERVLSNNRKEDVYQVHVIPRVMGISAGEAVAEQLRRDGK